MSIPQHSIDYKVVGTCCPTRAPLLLSLLEAKGYICTAGTNTLRKGNVPAVRIRYHFASCTTCDETELSFIGGMIEMFNHLVDLGKI